MRIAMLAAAVALFGTACYTESAPSRYYVASDRVHPEEFDAYTVSGDYVRVDRSVAQRPHARARAVEEDHLPVGQGGDRKRLRDLGRASRPVAPSRQTHRAGERGDVVRSASRHAPQDAGRGGGDDRVAAGQDRDRNGEIDVGRRTGAVGHALEAAAGPGGYGTGCRHLAQPLVP